jgi:peptidoglycan/xylan/chitin deacetylase (PgdA/CDA1 family)
MSRVMRQTARWIAAGTAGRLGIVASHARQRRLGGRWGIILRYHRVIPNEEPAAPYRMGLGVDLFTSQIAWLAEHARVVSLEEFLHWRDSGKTPPQDLYVLTFDDGYRDNLTHAAPVLERHGMTGTFYITAACLTERMPFWPEVLSQVVRLTSARSRALEVNGVQTVLELGTPEERVDTCLAMIERLRKMPAERISAEVARIADVLQVDVERARAATPPVLSADDLRALAAKGHGIGSHTVSHPYLAAEPQGRQREEIEGSKRLLEDALRTPVLDFCYPGGGYTATTRDIVAAAGYRSATTSDLGIAGPEDDIFRLPRVGVGEALARGPSGSFSPVLMHAETSGFFADLYRSRRTRKRASAAVTSAA